MENHPFYYVSHEVVIQSKLGEVLSYTGHFENCFNQCYFVVAFHCGKDDVIFYFRKLDDAIKFYNKYTKHFHSYQFLVSRMQSFHKPNYIFNLLYDDSINVNRFENPNRQKVLEFYASCCSMNFKIVPNGKNSFSLVPIIEKSRE